MFDTLSSAMHKRPLVVSDEDSDILAEAEPSIPGLGADAATLYRAGYMKQGDSKLWGHFFLQQKRFESDRCVTRWPCSLKDAAATLCDAAPVKVLLFRKVTHVQTLLSRQVRYEKLEESIHEALRVHQHWNDTYGLFIADCMANHDDLPPRIQSWYVVLAGHWHLAGLLLADLIEAIDASRIGLESQRHVRELSRLVWSLRKQNAYAISDLGSCSSPRPDSSFPRGPEFHFAVNKGALLTEPWTAVLIRSFGKAGYILLEWIASSGETNEVVDKCEACIQALWYLGRKSDMAMMAARALSAGLKAKRPVSIANSFAEAQPTVHMYQGSDFLWQEEMVDLMSEPLSFDDLDNDLFH
ncbi:hypothetical protein MBLNU459_g7776t2 [Dothideomycetes sp. NU459]